MSKRNSFTPGPWVAMCNQTNAAWYIHHKAAHENEAPIARTLADERESSNSEANARLIAAAPEMLAALEEMVFFCNQTGSGPSGIRYSMEAAIKKARGVTKMGAECAVAEAK